jgi:hypothetical protein
LVFTKREDKDIGFYQEGRQKYWFLPRGKTKILVFTKREDKDIGFYLEMLL